MDTGIVQIHGKSYQTVAYRVKLFRKDHPKWSMITDIITIDDKSIVMKCKIINEANCIIATGHAEEKRNDSQINKTSALENCETSAIGRALANLGYISSEFCSAEELANALLQQQTKEYKPNNWTKPIRKENKFVTYPEKHIKIGWLPNAEKEDEINLAKDQAEKLGITCIMVAPSKEEKYVLKNIEKQNPKLSWIFKKMPYTSTQPLSWIFAALNAALIKTKNGKWYGSRQWLHIMENTNQEKEIKEKARVILALTKQEKEEAKQEKEAKETPF